ncbi:hypothetical protein ABC383_07875 [Noviherbaspirillum sp. 1P10PC]|uniref:hypothetical protein n=1 Tax=Noviherbaspirillum sp. 1P10PC TaxID=3132292 RepID=UPI0039A2DA36
MTGTTPTMQHAESTQPHAAASKPQTIREFEVAMRALGYSRAEAKAIASAGFKGFKPDDAVSDQFDELADALRSLTQSFKR